MLDKTHDLDMPEGLSAAGKKAHKAIVEYLKKMALTDTGGCKAFYSPKEWKDRGEKYGLESELVICHDGGDLYDVFNWDSDGNYCHQYRLIEGVNAELKKVGLYVEACTGWYSAVYKA